MRKAKKDTIATIKFDSQRYFAIEQQEHLIARLVIERHTTIETSIEADAKADAIAAATATTMATNRKYLLKSREQFVCIYVSLVPKIGSILLSCLLLFNNL